jgi:Kef-type K+ transport system membrane component KefB
LKRETLLYLLITLGVGLGIFFVLHAGNQLAPTGAVSAPAAVSPTSSAFAEIGAGLSRNLRDPLSRLFLQLVIILAAARLTGQLFTRLGQPSVVGEMAAGMLLGPSLFGLVAPAAFHFVFDPGSLGALKLFSQIGVCLFMFTVGMELDVAQVRSRARLAVVVSHASIVIPYFLGVVLAYFLYRGFAQAGASFTAFGLFMGVSMSITAFPVLARILQDRGLSRTALGMTALTCAAIDDVTAWSILAFVVSVVRSTGPAAAAFSVLLVLLFLVLMLWVVKPALPRLLGREVLERPEPGKGALALVAGLVMASAMVTEAIGIHALFGAFLAGAIMPALADFRHKLAVRVENFSSVLLLPLFFAFTGLRTQLGLLHGVEDWLICLAIIAVATLGKMGGSAATARLTGLPWNDSLQLGALMNTRGLMELIALNIGFDLGVLSPRIFTMLVIMALVTTATTGPLLTLLESARRPAVEPVPG